MTLLHHHSHRLAAAAILLLVCVVPSCQSVPSHHKIMRYHRHEELKAAREIANLRARYEEGEISEETYHAQARAILDSAPEKAMDSLYRDYLLSTRTALEAGTRTDAR